MATFFRASNNGVIAVVSEEVYIEMQERQKFIADCEANGLPRPQLPPVTPIFTFSSPTHRSFNFMTGSLNMLSDLLKGHNVESGLIWVPFSNGTEWHGDKSAQWEMKFMTSLDEVMKTFGLEIVR